MITLETGSNINEVELLRQVLQGHIERKGQCTVFCVELLTKFDKVGDDAAPEAGAGLRKIAEELMNVVAGNGDSYTAPYREPVIVKIESVLRDRLRP